MLSGINRYIGIDNRSYLFHIIFMSHVSKVTLELKNRSLNILKVDLAAFISNGSTDVEANIRQRSSDMRC